MSYIDLPLLKKITKLVVNIPNFNFIKNKDFICINYIRSKTIKTTIKGRILNFKSVLDRLEGDIFSIKPKPYNK